MLTTRDRSAALEVIDSLGSAVHLIDVDRDGAFRVFAINRRAEKDLGLRQEQVAGRTLEEAFVPRVAADLTRHYRRCVEERRMLEYVGHSDAPAGRRYALSTLVPLMNGEGRVVRLLETAVEITGQKRARERAERAERRLRAALAMAAFGRRAGGLVHELKNRLAVVRGYAEWAVEGLEGGDLSPARARKVLDATEQTVERARELLDSMESGPAATEDVDLAQLVRAARPVIERLVGEEVHLRLECGVRGAWVHAQPDELEQTLIELVLNARDAMSGGGTLTISVQRIPGEEVERVRLAVRDTGVGMDAATRARAFDPHFTTKERGNGTGLGLCAVAETVRHWGGELRVHSRPGAGALFEVFLPRRQRCET